MSFASLAIGSNDVEAMSTAASTAVLIISAIRTNAIESNSTISSIFETSTASAATQHDHCDQEVDPHVPLRPEHVDDPLERDVEALEDRRRPTPRDRAHPAALENLALALLHPVAVVEAEQMEDPVHEWPPPLVADDLRADDDVAERARNAVGELVEAVDRKREHVGLLVDPEMLAP